MYSHHTLLSVFHLLLEEIKKVDDVCPTPDARRPIDCMLDRSK